MRWFLRHIFRRPSARCHGFAMLVGMILFMANVADAAADRLGGRERLLGAAGCALDAGEGGVVDAVLDGESLRLDSGLEVRLAGMESPGASQGRRGDEASPLADEAKAELARIALGQAVELRYGGERRDRYGRALAQLFVLPEDGDEIWVQQAMVGSGLARVSPRPDSRQCLDALIDAERAARRSALGLWADPYYVIASASDPDLALRHDRYDLIEGRVLSVGERGPIVYLDFGLNWSTDFTVVVSSEVIAALAGIGLEPADFKGQRVRVRGWIEQRGGPSIRVTQPEQLELLDDGRQ